MCRNAGKHVGSVTDAGVAVNHRLRLSSGPHPRPPRTSHHSHTRLPEDNSTELIKQPETRPISQEQLVAEVKGIYAGLVMVENKCIEIDNAQNTQSDPNNTKLNNDQWQALIALHRTLLREHHDFFLAANHPSANPALKRLASKYSQPCRFPKIGGEALSILDLISHFISKLEQGADGELLELVQMTEDVLDRLYKQFWQADFETLVYLLLFYCFFNEFPSGIRHLCTTMPWTIWPALVVLWGVCWMFIQSRADPRYDPSLLPRQPQWERDLDDAYGMFLNPICARAVAYDVTVDFAAIYQTSDSSFLHGSWSPDLTTSHATFGELELPSPPIHNSFTGSYQTSDPLTMMSNQDIFPTFSTSPYVGPASLAITLPQTVPLAAGPVPEPLHTPANEDSNWTSQHLAPVTASAQNMDAHHVPQPDRATMQRVPEGTIRTRATL